MVYNNELSFVKTVFLGPVSHIHHASETRVLLLQPIESLVDVLELEVLVYGKYLVVRTELQHVLHLHLTAHVRTSHCYLLTHQVLTVQNIRSLSSGSSHHNEYSSRLGQTLMQPMQNRLLDVQS